MHFSPKFTKNGSSVSSLFPQNLFSPMLRCDVNVTKCLFAELRNSPERRVEEDQFAVACEGKLTFSPEQISGENEFCVNEVES